MILTPLIVTVSLHLVIRGEGGGKKARESNTGTYEISPKAYDTLTSGQEITQCADLPYLYPLELLRYTFVCENDDTNQHA